MSSSNPPRKFAPTPIEETTKSSRQRPTANGGDTKPRRFAPEPVEETVRSSKDAPQQPEEPPKSKPKRFAPEPVEHTTKSSKGARQKPPEQDEKPKARRFAPQLVEESGKSSKETSALEKKQHIKFKPEPIATTYGSNRKARRQGEHTPTASEDTELEKRPPRKFTPILLDTARRSRRAGDPNAPISQDYRTEYGYHAHPREHWKRVTGQITPSAVSQTGSENGGDEDDDEGSVGSDQSLQRRKLSPLDGSAPARPSCFVPQRTRSFRTPELDTIESSESEDGSKTSSPPTPRQEGSPIAVTNSFELFKHATKRRESIDEDWTHYLLDLERKKAQERLEEQALAAYPNADFGYEHPHHYFVDDDDDDEDEEFEIEERPVTWDGNEDDLLEMARRESAVNMPWEQRELQRYAEDMQQERNANKTTAKQQIQSPWMKIDAGLVTADPNAELKSMLERARPPMLGNDLVFPRCASPDPARFDVTQGATALRNQMCNLTAAAENEQKQPGEEGGLWQALKSEKESDNTAKSPVSVKASPPKGLWGGFCVEDGDISRTPGGLKTPKQPTGIQTPQQEAPNPFQLAFAEGRPVGVMTPGTPAAKTVKNKSDLQHLNAILATEGEIDKIMEQEYPDSFITQVYNYLSLGYPSLARYFDEELSKISRVPISELRQDDEKAKATPRGYIRLGSDFEGGGGEGVTEVSCMRWQALKRYVREWARQEKNMLKSDGVFGNWGTGARRGSWAI